MAERAEGGSVYVQGSGRTNSVLSYILYTIEALGYEISQIRTFRNEKGVSDPLSKSSLMIGDSKIDSNKIDDMLITNSLNFELKDEGIIVDTKNRSFKIQFDPKRFRQSDVPILLANAAKIKEDLGVIPCRQITEIITDQVNYYLDPEHRINIFDESYESMSAVLKSTA
jgi:GDPmannose 4,6-dehydratase